jgi:hypothetical protein
MQYAGQRHAVCGRSGIRGNSRQGGVYSALEKADENAPSSGPPRQAPVQRLHIRISESFTEETSLFDGRRTFIFSPDGSANSGCWDGFERCVLIPVGIASIAFSAALASAFIAIVRFR